MSDERRKFKRFDAYMSIKCSTGADENEKTFGVGLSKDVSRDGICINSNESIQDGSMVTLEIDLPDDPRPIRTSGQVVWAKSGNEEQGADYGIKFLSIDPVDKFRVLDYAYNHWLETKVNDFSDPEEVVD